MPRQSIIDRSRGRRRREEEEIARPRLFSMSTRSSNRAPTTPKEKKGTLEGLLFQLEESLREKVAHSDRIKGEISFLQRRINKLRRELLYKNEERLR